ETTKVEINNSIERFVQFFREANSRKYYAELLKIAKVYPERKSLLVDYVDLEKFDTEIADFLLANPEEALRVAQDAIFEIDLPIEGDYKINVRFFNSPKESEVTIRDIRAEHIERFITIEGIVKGTTEVRPEAIRIEFECPVCRKPIIMSQFGRKIRSPFVCDDPACGGRGYFKVQKVDLVDSQIIQIQEPPEDIVGSEQPAHLPVHLTDDIVSPKESKKVLPGNRIKITGLLRKIPAVSRAGAQLTKYDLYIDANYVEPIEREFEEIELNSEDEKAIKKLAKDPHLYEKFITSIAPSIFGYPEIKEAILLQLFGGIPKSQPDGTKIRGNIHLFLIGDPAVGKSQLLWYVSRLAPKGRFVSGKKASGAGLTAAVVRDEVTGGFILEAGAMILANKGIVCVDEFDKMDKDDMSAMLEAMEQGTISIAKAGIVTTLNADTTILAAANPKYGRFDTYKSLIDQIDLGTGGAVVLSRFDLKFVIQDVPGPEKDTALADHVLESLTAPERIEPKLSIDLIRKYIAYAKKTSKPKLTEDAKKIIKSFYVSWRSKYREEGGEMTVALTPRQLEALIRISEASARVRLGGEVTVDDARRAIRLLEYSLRAVGYEPETGRIDIDRIDIGISSVQRGRMHTMLTIVNELTEGVGKAVPIEDILVKAKGQGIDNIAAMEVINKLKEKGDLFEPRPGYIQRA
ncbi:TPA: minichromosome maintenance protein MCM, partial [archaeon]|nr:minichromosome maintenance protein MCM [Candidatus Naiadarchaeales archaeon SRR2090153.bin1042]